MSKLDVHICSFIYERPYRGITVFIYGPHMWVSCRPYMGAFIYGRHIWVIGPYMDIIYKSHVYMVTYMGDPVHIWTSYMIMFIYEHHIWVHGPYTWNHICTHHPYMGAHIWIWSYMGTIYGFVKSYVHTYFDHIWTEFSNHIWTRICFSLMIICWTHMIICAHIWFAHIWSKNTHMMIIYGHAHIWSHIWVLLSMGWTVTY